MVEGANTFFLVVFFGFLFLMLLLGIWAARRVRSGEDFLLSGRNLGVPLLLGTTLATLVGTGSSLGAVGFGFESGWAGALYGIGGAAGVFGLLLFADVRKYKFMTFSEELSFFMEPTGPSRVRSRSCYSWPRSAGWVRISWAARPTCRI